MPSQLGYWNIRGLATPLRAILTYAGEDFEDVRYKLGPAPEYSREEWFSVKFTLDLPFPNLPYYIDDDVKITQSNAIFRYLGKKFNLEGETTQEKALCDVALENVMDMRNAFIKFCYYLSPEEFKATTPQFVKDAKARISSFNVFLADKDFLVGAKVTVSDFHLFEMLEHHKAFDSTILDDCPKLKEYMERMEALPRMKELMETERKFLINGPMANFH